MSNLSANKSSSVRRRYVLPIEISPDNAGVSRTACLGAELHLRLLVRPRGKVVVLAQEVVIVCLCLKDTEIHASSKQGNTTNSALESLHSLHLPRT